MNVLRITSHEPSVNEINYPRNKKIKITFDRALDISTLSHSVASLNDSNFKTVSGELKIEYSLIGDKQVPNILSFYPKRALPPETKFTFYVYDGRGSLRGQDGSQLLRAYSFDFKSGSTILDQDDQPLEEQDLERVKYLIDQANQAGDYEEVLRLIQLYKLIEGYEYDEPDEPEPEIIKKLSLIKTNPMNQQPNVELDQYYITLKFDDILDVDNYDLGSIIDVKYKNVLE